MKIIYIANARIPTERAHGIQIMKMCEAFAKIGHEVTLVVPMRFNSIKEDAFSYYNIDKLFDISYMYTVDLVKFGRIGFWIQSILFSLNLFFNIVFKKADVIYSRDEMSLFLLSFFKKNVVWESHSEKVNFLAKRLLNKLNSIITITNGLRKFYVDHGCKENKILVAHDGVDLDLFSINKSKVECRQKLNLPLDKKIVLYTGHLYEWKGVQTLADASKLFSDNTILFFVGGTERDILSFKKNNKEKGNINILGYRPYREIPIWMCAADVLVIPNIDNRETSPMKMFEYMASGRSIVASDLRSLGEVLNKNNAVLIEPGNAIAFAEGINMITSNEDLSNRISSQSLLLSKEYSWESRAKRIINFIQRLNV